ncbi:hypothetical protein [Streptomyces sp. NPDC004296]|uniref:hypothetical protein n=1 Tax=Streptomyces sp. NPDC004296 TaxID=3364697 RepID=UPI0036A9C989
MWPFSGKKWEGTGSRRRPDGEPNPHPVKPWWFQWDEWEAARPDWRLLRKSKDRYAATMPLSGQPMAGYPWHVSAGELPDPDGTGEGVEALLWQLKESIPRGRSSTDLVSSGVALTFPRTLPPFGFYPQSDHWRARRADFFYTTPERLLREYDALAALGPGHGQTRVLVADDRVFSALVRPEVLQRPQLTGRHVRLNGNHAVAWAKGYAAPAMLEECAIELYELVNLLPRTWGSEHVDRVRALVVAGGLKGLERWRFRSLKT